MRKLAATIVASVFASFALAQDVDIDNRLANIDWHEDSTEIKTVKDIVKQQQAVSNRAASAAHYAKVWRNHGFFNIAYHTKGTMEPQKYIPTGLNLLSGYNGGLVPKFTAKWGASIQAGKNIKLHKPIANTAQFNIDFTGVDLSANYYKTENGGKGVYDSSKQWDEKDADGSVLSKYYYMHWNLEKLEVSYGMSIGPSLTLAPFTHVQGAKGLHYLKFNAYYHVGYNASLLLMLGDIESDVQYKNSMTKTQKEDLKERNENQFVVGHGLYQSMGFNMTWKRIGFGYEHRWGSLKYKNVVAKREYGKETYKFDTVTNRIYLTYRFGK